MSAPAQGTAINRELRELERQATETLSLEPVLPPRKSRCSGAGGEAYWCFCAWAGLRRGNNEAAPQELLNTRVCLPKAAGRL
jgi:hypothetical protein